MKFDDMSRNELTERSKHSHRERDEIRCALVRAERNLAEEREARALAIQQNQRLDREITQLQIAEAKR